MKEYIAETGGRYTYSDDILNLQELALSMSAVFDGCSDFIISGCEIEGPKPSDEPEDVPGEEEEQPEETEERAGRPRHRR
ncbi:hypothetical protein [uncultured Alistipes sp.]|uniref:hypothetical protein n=1 Tax=uncultured Alistipes sp. TaxID=538949 RepID=UPI002666E865|nr:hypothetical protein [uncultured Alistipes sp.]